jgi:hypothetical protein
MGTIEPARPDDNFESHRRLEAAVRGDRAVLGALPGQRLERLRRMVVARMLRRLQGRVDPSDVI